MRGEIEQTDTRYWIIPTTKAKTKTKQKSGRQQLTKFATGWKVREWRKEQVIVKIFKKCRINMDDAIYDESYSDHDNELIYIVDCGV